DRINSEMNVMNDENDQQKLYNKESTYILVIDFKKMSPRCHQKLKFVKICIEYEHKFFLYVHPTLGTHYAANQLDLRSAVYLMEFITFPQVANDPADLTILQNWVMEGAQQEDLDIQAIQQKVSKYNNSLKVIGRGSGYSLKIKAFGGLGTRFLTLVILFEYFKFGVPS
ncbi:45405_t:CDS:2, partial [Gigaspora margarita]